MKSSPDQYLVLFAKACVVCILTVVTSCNTSTGKPGAKEPELIPVFEESFSDNLSKFGYNDELMKANRYWGDKKWLSEGCITLKNNSSSKPGTFYGLMGKLQIPYLRLSDGKLFFESKLEKNATLSVYLRNNKEKRNAEILKLTSGKMTLFEEKNGVLHTLKTVVNSKYDFKPDTWNDLEIIYQKKKFVLTLNGKKLMEFFGLEENGFGGIMICVDEREKELKVKNLKVWAFNDSKLEPYVCPDSSSWPKEKIIIEFPEVPAQPLRRACEIPHNEEMKKEAGEISGTLVGFFRTKHKWKLSGTELVFDGKTIIPIAGGDGEYFAETKNGYPSPPIDKTAMERIKTYGLTVMPVILEPVDYIDCSREDHNYTCDPVIDGEAKLMEIKGKKYRVTSCRNELSYFSYVMKTDKPTEPHVLIAEEPNDRERYTVIRIQPPQGYLSNYMYNIGTGCYTGRDLPCDGKDIYQYMFFYPRSKRFRFSVSRLPKELNYHPDNGGAVSRIWLYRLKEPLWKIPNPAIAAEGKEQRKIGVSLTQPLAIYRIRSGFHEDNTNISEKAGDIYGYLHYLSFCGMNQLLTYVVDGNDATTSAYYEGSKYLPGRDYFLFSRFFPAAANFNIDIIPGIPSLICHPNLKVKDQLSKNAFLIDKKGKQVSWIWPNLDPVNPEANAVQMGLLKEICERVRNIKSIEGISIRINAAIGSCFSKGPIWVHKSGYDSGYSKWDLEQFRKDTKLEVPVDNPTEAYEWLRKNAWEKWISWRCEKMKKFWLATRDMIRSYNPRWKLVVRIVLPNRTTDRYELWAKENISVKELYRYYGFDPDLYKNEKGLKFIRERDFGADRYFIHHYDKDLEKVKAVKRFEDSPEIKKIYSKLNSGFELYFTYWEEHGALPGSTLFGGRWPPHWGAATVTAYGRWLYKPIIDSITGR